MIKKIATDSANVYCDLRKESDHTYKFDPFTIMMMISIIVNIARLWHDCKKSNKDIHSMAANPNLLQRRALRRVVAQHVDPKFVDDAFDAILERAKDMSFDDVSDIMNDFRTNHIDKA